jgi:hypothetical protein
MTPPDTDPPRPPLTLGRKTIQVVNTPAAGTADPNAPERILAENLALQTAAWEQQVEEDVALLRRHRWSRIRAVASFAMLLVAVNGGAALIADHTGWDPTVTAFLAAACGTFTVVALLFVWMR